MKTEKNGEESFVHRQKEILISMYASALGLVQASDFFPRVAYILSQAESLGLSCSGLSVFLMEENSLQATHYYLYPSPIGWEPLSLAEHSVEVEVHTTRKAKMWQDSAAGRSLCHLTVPSTLGVVTVTDHRPEGFSPAEWELVEELARSLEILAIRHRDLHAREMSEAKTTQIDADLVALFNGSFELAGETSDEVIRRVLQMIIDHLAFDRAGVFLIDPEKNILQGAWGVDEQGEITPIPTTVFPLYPERESELSEAAQIARGELEFFLTSNLDGEGRNSIEGDIKASVTVPMRIGQQILGVLAADNYITDRPLSKEQITPLMILANQGAIAIENVRLYEQLRRSHRELEQRVEQRTAELREEITERARTEEALRESESKFKELAELLPVIIYEINLHGKITYANRIAFDKFGYSFEDFEKGLFSHQLIAPRDKKRAKMNTAKMLHGEKPEGNEYAAQKKDGSTFSTMTYSSPILKEGKPEGLRGIIIDITELKQGEEERARLEARILQAEKMEAMGNLAGGVAHDLNNILSGVIGFPELILMDLPEESPLRVPLQTIKDSGERAAQIVQDLLTLARRGVSVREVINANHILSIFLKSPEYDQLKSAYPGIEVETDFAADLLNILGSSVHLSKTVMNLVANAVEAMPEGGKLTLSTKNRYLDRAIRGYTDVEEGDYVVISVSDMGTGISPEDLERIFEPFYTKKKMGRSGTGLGMMVVWGTVKDHNGYIDVQSAVGEGSTFTLYFPVTRQEAPNVQPGLSIEEYMGHGESILVVDDVEEQQKLATAILTKLNYSVTAVSSGEEAVKLLCNGPVDLLVLDMIMDPGMDGLDTYRCILELYPNQKAIIASGFSETDRVEETQKLGAGAYVKKPYVIEKLGIAVRTELDNGP